MTAAAKSPTSPVDARPMDMADLPAQEALAPADAAQARARYFNSGNAFNIKLPPVPGGVFTQQPAAALAPDAPTGFIACDQSAAMDCPFPATTPLMLARYAVIAAGETLAADFRATGSIWYVISGSGTARQGDEAIGFSAGDVFLLTGTPATLFATSRTVLWGVSNEPQLAFDGDLPPDDARRPVDMVHYPAAEIARQIEIIYRHQPAEGQSGVALIFSSDRQQAARNILPTLTLSLNTLPPASHQKAHRHNSAAITLVLNGDDSYSMVGGERCPWSPFATLVTPPGAPHSHHNGGDSRALFLIVQDGGLHYHARTMGFAFLE
ncbi:cupin domain-containing protein [Azorhizobium doebereinerae]|uniref:cupin domain-containing protein n=1 Tax=Azorhizobium doebereinerae TaxID=281091 RepID=UPI00040C4C9E|nr:cupin domain-containing protein [Azorhizobium doebereinerae]